jgi:predicted O-linked N-acetylglucosamine transferase (SPINDLY family)
MSSKFPGASRRSPTDIMTILGRAIAAHQAGNLANAKSLYQLVLAENERQFDALHMLGVLAGQAGEFAEADRLIRLALEVDAQSFEALANHARVLLELKQYDQALAVADRALALDPNYVNAHLFRGSALLLLRRFEPALRSFDRALALQPDFVVAIYNRGEALFGLRRYDDALFAYQKALSVQPNYAGAWKGTGDVLYAFRRFGQALAAYDKAVAINPHLAEAWLERSNVLYQLDRLDEALRSQERALELKPELSYALGLHLVTKLRLCDWDSLEDECARLLSALRAGADVCGPFTPLAVPCSPADHLRCAQLFADKHKLQERPLFAGRRQSGDRIRIAYLSADFRQHVMASVIAELVERHDRSRFETLGVSFGPDDRSELRARLGKAFDRFQDVTTNTDREIAQLLHEAEVDIAVDLMGHTDSARPGILAHRPAPIQVSYLGFPGTMGTDFIDYILADRHVLPFEQQPFFTEKIVHLPDSYQPTDTRRAASSRLPTRSEIGLPEDAFVFCCFNSAYKFLPQVFDIWMRLLQSVDGSVLWLAVAHETARERLRKQAERRGVDARRLVLTPPVGHADYLARQTLADLFLDTLPYNAHATGSNALAAGLPVLTCRGEAFAGRVGASLLHAAGLPELVTESLGEYEALARELASNRGRLQSIRRKLEANRASCTLFDTARLCRHIESAYDTMWERHRRGEPPASFAVTPISAASG